MNLDLNDMIGCCLLLSAGLLVGVRMGIKTERMRRVWLGGVLYFLAQAGVTYALLSGRLADGEGLAELAVVLLLANAPLAATLVAYLEPADRVSAPRKPDGSAA